MKILLYIIIILNISCEKNHIRTYKLSKVVKLDNNSFDSIKLKKTNSKYHNWVIPDYWKKSQGSEMRLASFDVNYSGEVGDVSVIKLSSDGGGLLSNINRWRRQLNLDPLILDEINNLLINKTGKLGSYDIVEIINEKESQSFICAIIPDQFSTIFVKLSINRDVMHMVKDDFINFCSSLYFD